ncbi:hypothetical protein GTW25_11505 [Aliihoeflea aestuarii]|jgi:hypothetical protein|uniref:hypothetical protein n=1 Tax=Aliihoeflea aestuarii TaxID=453840 RepID=UPI0020933F56|nr:hypothetical protein [Aliihoeflea aestuarii]MCO6391657.1 hypothetical protein [Aliihoeflea aestuarii]
MIEATKDDPLAKSDRALLVHLSKLASDPGNRIFAVMDGAFFNDIGSELRDAGITRRPLYRYGGNYSVVVGGPWLVNPYRDNSAGNPDRAVNSPAWMVINEEERASGKSDAEIYAERMNASLEVGDPTGGGMVPTDDMDNIDAVVSRFETLLLLSSGKPGPVFWVGDAALTEEAIYGHLRRLNKVEVPRGQTGTGGEMIGELSKAAATTSEIGPSEQAETYELVIFRHADANVMAQILPALSELQLARLFGPCHQILFAPEPDWGGGVQRARKADDLPAAPSGSLRWDRDTVHAIQDGRFVQLDRRFAATLSSRYPDSTFESNVSLTGRVRHHRQRAQARFNVSADQHLLDYLEIVLTHGEAATNQVYFQQVMGRRGWRMEDRFQRLRRYYLPSVSLGVQQ